MGQEIRRASNHDIYIEVAREGPIMDSDSSEISTSVSDAGHVDNLSRDVQPPEYRIDFGNAVLFNRSLYGLKHAGVT